MKKSALGKTGLNVSRLSFGASSMGGVFRRVTEEDAISAAHTALDLGINYLDVSPAYGGTLAETVLGKALKGIPRESYVLSTKVGKSTALGTVGEDSFDFSRDGIRKSLAESAERLGVSCFDIVHLHDIEYGKRIYVEQALDEGLAALQELREEGCLNFIGIGMYPVELWERVLDETPIDVGLTHNIYCLNDTRLLELLPRAHARGIGLINASPLASGLLTDRGAADWHPANADERAVFAKAATHCSDRGASISRLAVQFACNHPDIPTTLFSSANPESVKKNVAWSQETPDPQLLSEVQDILAPVADKEWDFFA